MGLEKLRAFTLNTQLSDITNQVSLKMDLITTSHTFADNTARDTYFTSHPTEKVINVLISVGAGYQQWDGSTWIAKTAIAKGVKGDTGTIPNIVPLNSLEYGYSNLIDLTKVVLGKTLNASGVEGVSGSGNVTDFIPINSNIDYMFGYIPTNTSLNIVFWFDSNKTLLKVDKGDASYGIGVPKVLTSPANAAYVRYNMYNQVDYKTLMIVRGTSYPSKYLKFGNTYFNNVELYNQKVQENGNDSIYLNKAYASENKNEIYDLYKYPIVPVWGHEYLYSWYEKLYNASAVKIAMEGDSTTYEGTWNTGGTRRDMVSKIFKIGQYVTASLTILNQGFGSATSGHWVGSWTADSLASLANPPCTQELYPNGTLDDTMSKNPDIIVWGFGINDASANLFPTDTIQQKLDRFERNLREGLGRIRGNVAINGRPAYNKSADVLGIILCTPLTTYDSYTTKTRDLWTKYTRQIIQKCCREFNCAFWDISMRHYDHEFSIAWSGITTNDGVHPRKAANADFVSQLQDLIYPMCLWKY